MVAATDGRVKDGSSLVYKVSKRVLVVAIRALMAGASSIVFLKVIVVIFIFHCNYLIYNIIVKGSKAQSGIKLKFDPSVKSIRVQGFTPIYRMGVT